MTAPPPHTVLILGAGLVGHTIAYHLNRRSYRVTLLDHPEWRDGFWLNPSDPVPILLGCYQEGHRLLHALNGQRPLDLDRPIPLEFRLPDGRHVSYRSARLPGAFQWMMSLFNFQGLAWQDRWRLFSHVEQIWEQAQTLPADLENRTADEWLSATGQSLEARERIWGRLAQWLTGNDLARLSAATFVQLLSTVFLSDASDARLMSVSGSIEQRFMMPMKQSLPHDRMEFRSLTRPPLLHFDENKIRDVRLHDGTTLRAQWCILALPHRHLRALLPERLVARLAYFAHMTDLTDLGEIAVRLTCRSFSQAPRLVLLTGHPFHRLTVAPAGPAEIDCRFSATADSLANLNGDQMRDAAIVELTRVFPNMAPENISVHELIQEPHATLSLAPGTARLRPLQQSPIQNLLVAGGWTDTGWPSNLESALVSAHRCSEIITGRPA